MSLARELGMTVFGVVIGAYVTRALERADGPTKRPDGRATDLAGLDGPGAHQAEIYDPRAAIAGEGRYARRY